MSERMSPDYSTFSFKKNLPIEVRKRPDGPKREQESVFTFQIFSESDRKILDAVAENFVTQVHDQKYDTLILLDSSARVFTPLIQERWKQRFPDTPVPDIKFIKMDRILRDRLSYPTMADPSKLITELQDAFHFKQGQKLLIVDEYLSTGCTLQKAKTLVQKAFPNIQTDMGALISGMKDDKDGWKRYLEREKQTWQ